MNRIARALLFSTICLAYTSAFAQQDFSADVVNGRNPDHKTKVYVTKTKMRLEDSSKGGMMGGIIINTETQVWDILMPPRQMYMETSDADRMPMARNMFKFFRPTDAEDGCTHWTKLKRPSDPDWDCRKIGDETVNGRSTVKYEGTSKKSGTHNVWIDKKIVFPIKWQSNDDSGESSGELQNIQEGPQAASLFEIPSDYQKMDMSQMMMGHSPKQ